MGTYNKTIIIGRLASNPEFIDSGNGKMRASFSVINHEVHDGQTSQSFHRIVAKGKQAKLCYDSLKKGDLCCIEGKLSTENSHVVIVAEQVVFLSSKKSNEQGEV